MKNYDVVKNFFNNRRGQNTKNLRIQYNLGSTDLVNYNTILVHKEYQKIYVNISRYSVTTAIIQSYINDFLQYEAGTITYYYGNKYGDNYKDEADHVKFIAFFDCTNNSGYGIEKIENDTIKFRYTRFNMLYNPEYRAIKIDRDGRPYFRFNKVKWYLDEIERTM